MTEQIGAQVLFLLLGALLGFGSSFLLRLWEDRRKAFAIRQQATVLLTYLQNALATGAYRSTKPDFQELRTSYTKLVFDPDAGLVFKKHLGLACTVERYLHQLPALVAETVKLKEQLDINRNKLDNRRKLLDDNQKQLERTTIELSQAQHEALDTEIERMKAEIERRGSEISRIYTAIDSLDVRLKERLRRTDALAHAAAAAIDLLLKPLGGKIALHYDLPMSDEDEREFKALRDSQMKG